MRQLTIVFSFVCALTGALVAQPAQPSAVLPDSPDLYFAFVRLHDSLMRYTESQSVKDANAATRLASHIGSQYGVNAAEAAALNAIVRETADSLKQWENRVKIYVDQQQANRKPLDGKAIQDLYT